MSKIQIKGSRKKSTIKQFLKALNTAKEELRYEEERKKYNLNFFIDSKTGRKISEKTASKRLREQIENEKIIVTIKKKQIKKDPPKIIIPNDKLFNSATGRIIDKRPKIKTDDYEESIRDDNVIDRIFLKNSERKEVHNEERAVVHLTFRVSNDMKEKYIDIFDAKGKTKEEIINEARDKLFQKGYNDIFHLNGNLTYDIGRSNFQETERNFKEMGLFDIKYYKLNVDIKSNNDKINYNCVHHALESILGSSLPKKTIKKLKDINSWTVDSLITFCNDNNINYEFYYKNFELYRENKPTHNKTLYGLLKNEHLYILNKNELSTLKTYNIKKTIIDSIKYNENVNDVVLNNIEHYKCEYFDIEKTYIDDDKFEHKINTAVFNKIKYTDDINSVISYNLYKKFIDVILTPNYKLFNPLLHICEVEKLNSLYAGFLDSPKALLYNSYGRSEFCIDKNGAYLSALISLEFIPVIDGDCLIEEYKNEKYNNYFYYIDKVINNKYGALSKGWTSGHRITNYDDVIITKILKPKLKDNPFKNLLLKMYNENKKMTKIIAQQFTGVLQCQPTSKECYNEILKSPHGYEEHEIIKIKKGLYITTKFYENDKLYTPSMMPLAHFIIDKSINTVLNKAQELINNNCIINKINTDSIAYQGKYRPEELDNINIYGWKEEKLKEEEYIKSLLEPSINEPLYIHNRPFKHLTKFDLNYNILFNCSAGAGKTHTILNKLLKYLIDEGYDLKDVLILSSTHKALGEYYNLTTEQKTLLNVDKLNVRTMAHYTNTNGQFIKEFKKYKILIIDEVALLGLYHYEFLYKNITPVQKIYGFGDTTQNLPVLHTYQPLDNELIYKSFFNGYMKLDENWRNNFSKEDYQKMKDLTYEIPQKIKNLIGKYTNYNICIKNDTKEKINLKIIKDKKYNDEYGLRYYKTTNKTGYTPFIIGEGCLITSINNNLSKIGIFNNTVFKISKYNDEFINIINIITNEEHKIEKDKFSKNFDYGYAYTDYRIQGASINIEEISFWDFGLIKKDGKKLYTCLSRIKEKLINKPKEYDIFIKSEDNQKSLLD